MASEDNIFCHFIHITIIQHYSPLMFFIQWKKKFRFKGSVVANQYLTQSTIDQALILTANLEYK
jgi:hypothetical protein